MLILKKKRVRFRYFEETKTEIDLFFFAKAEEIVKGKVFFLKDLLAFKHIINNSVNNI